jgi:multiple sugar transport system ATP-binding protein
MNIVTARLTRVDSVLVVSFGEHRFAIDDELMDEQPALAAYEGGEVIVGIRPEDFEDAAFAADAPAGRTVTTVCSLREALGSEVLVHFPIARPSQGSEPTEQLGDGSPVFVARIHPQTAAREGEPLNLVVDTRRLHFFEPGSGRAIHREALSSPLRLAPERRSRSSSSSASRP